MLSLAKVCDSAQAASYYEEVDNYYNESGKSPSQWMMSGAERLGLNGAVDAVQFRDILDGHLPDGSSLSNSSENRRLATDLTFSAPKSVSMQALVGGDSALIDAHDQAVKKALDYVEKLSAYRVTENGVTRTEASDNMLVAAFRHDTSRAQDPNLHTHAIAINATQGPDGQWRAQDITQLYKQKMLIGALYRNELALSVKELGYEIHQTHADGRFELSHISREQIEEFSTRSSAIEAALDARGKTRETASSAEKQVITLATRENKSYVDRVQLLAGWREKSADLGVNYHPELTQKLDRQDGQNSAKNAVNYAVEHATERQSVINEITIIQHALEHGTGNTNLQEIKTEILLQVASGELIRSGERYTTKAAQLRERDMLAIEARGRNALQPIVNQQQAVTRLEQTTLNAGQRAAAEFIASNEHRIAAIQGSAGTGKTTLLKEAQILINDRGYKMLGVAPSAAAANELSARGIESQTLARLHISDYKTLDEKTVLVVDECSMVGAKDMHNLLQAAEAKQARVILMGDTQQLAAVEAGKPFAQLQKGGIPNVQVGEIIRQKDAELKRAVELAARGSVEQSLSILKSKIHEVGHFADRYDRIAKDYVALSPESRSETLIVAGTNSARAAINQNVREGLGLAGKGIEATALVRKDLTLTQSKMSQSYQPGDVVQAMKSYKGLGLERGDIAVVQGVQPGRIRLEKQDGSLVDWRPAIETNVSAFRAESREFAIGDKVRFTQNDYSLGVANGDRATVSRIDSGRLTLAMENGNPVSLSTQGLLHLDHSYCQTVHSSQGQTIGRILIDADTNSLTSSQNTFYVAISRAEYEVVIYTNDKEMLPQAMGRENEKSAALDLEKAEQMAM